MTYQSKNNNLNYLVDPAFTNVGRWFVLSFENENDGTSFSKYYVPNVQIEDFNVLIDGKIDGKIIKMGRNNDYTTGNLLDYEYLTD